MHLFSKAWSPLLALLLLNIAPAMADSTIVARVGAIPVTVYELNRQVQKVLPLQVSFHGGISQEKIDAVKEQALEELITEAYKVQYALAEELSVPNSAVDERVAEVRKRFKSDEDFQKALGEEGLTGYRASIYRGLLAKKAQEVAVDSQVKVTEEQVRQYYESNKTRFMRPKQFQASHILIKVDPASNDEKRQVLLAKAEDLAKRAQAGEDFYNLAYFNSDDRTKYVGGNLGLFHEGQTVKEFEEALLQLKPGEISPPVRTLYGYHIIKLDAVEESRQLEYAEMAGKLRQQLENEQREALEIKWLEKLKSEYKVEK